MFPLSLSPGRTCSGRVPEVCPPSGRLQLSPELRPVCLPSQQLPPVPADGSPVPVCPSSHSCAPSRLRGVFPALEQCFSVLFLNLQKPLSLLEVPGDFPSFG